MFTPCSDRIDLIEEAVSSLHVLEATAFGPILVFSDPLADLDVGRGILAATTACFAAFGALARRGALARVGSIVDARHRTGGIGWARPVG